jgi:hypothetical protein
MQPYSSMTQDGPHMEHAYKKSKIGAQGQSSHAKLAEAMHIKPPAKHKCGLAAGNSRAQQCNLKALQHHKTSVKATRQTIRKTLSISCSKHHSEKICALELPAQH